MTRKEMIEEIAKQAGCSKRLVRKTLFRLSGRVKREDIFKRLLFNQAFLNKDTDWKDHQKLRKDWNDKSNDYKARNRDLNPWVAANQFEVVFLTSGCNVLFMVGRICEDGYVYTDGCGERLYNY